MLCKDRKCLIKRRFCVDLGGVAWYFVEFLNFIFFKFIVVWNTILEYKRVALTSYNNTGTDTQRHTYIYYLQFVYMHSWRDCTNKSLIGAAALCHKFKIPRLSINSYFFSLYLFQPDKLNVYKNDSDTSWDYTLTGKINLIFVFFDYFFFLLFVFSLV